MGEAVPPDGKGATAKGYPAPGKAVADILVGPETLAPAPDHAPTLELEELRRELRKKDQEAEALRRRLHALGADPATPSMGTASGLGSRLHSPGPRGGGRPLSIVIPMMGLGEAFAEAGFRLPKPLVNVVGRPVLLWLLDHLTLTIRDTVHLVVPSLMERQHGIAKLVSQEFPMMRINVVTLPFETRGWVETVQSVVSRMSGPDLRNLLVVLDCSTIYYDVDLLSEIRKLPEGTGGASVYFEPESAISLIRTGSDPAQFSYLRLDGENKFITDIAEKQVISSLANTGAYIFCSGRDFRVAAARMLEAFEESGKGSLYASDLIKEMLRDNQQFLGVCVDHSKFEIVSTPPQLSNFIRRVSIGEVNMARKMRFCFDLDGTLLTLPRVPEDLSSCEPIPTAIALVRQLREKGHTIVLTTSRGMHLGRGVDAAIAEVGGLTFDSLRKFEIPYDELHFGMPCADFYLDARLGNPEVSIERDLGWYVGKGASDGEAIEGAVDARAFNLVRSKGKGQVMKSSTPDVLRGECHWYRSIPSDLAHFFPRVETITEDETVGEIKLSSITMARVSGVTFSHLVTSRLLTKAGLRSLTRALHKIHTQEPPPESSLANEPKVTSKEMCANYASKVRKRVSKFGELYKSLGHDLGLDTDRMAGIVIGFLDEFETMERARQAWYIHGDPVFSNVMRKADGGIALLDMRGELGARLTTQGDVHYDLSKVYQSLCGYDFMLLDEDPDETSSELFDGLRAAFWEELKQLYPGVSHRDVRLHTAAHFFAIVPLHELRSRMQRYLRTSYSMLHVEGMM